MTGFTSNPASVQDRIDRTLRLKADLATLPESVTVFGRVFTDEGSIRAFWAAWTDEQRAAHQPAYASDWQSFHEDWWDE